MNKIRKVINVITYFLLMFIGGIIFLGFIFLGIATLMFLAPNLQNFINWINETFGVSWTNEINSLIMFVFSIPFVFMSLNGVAIILLTQRTSTIRKTIKKDVKRKIKKNVNKEIEKSTKEGK